MTSDAAAVAACSDAAAFAACSDDGRLFECRRRVGLGDVRMSGHLRLDALAAYLQDIASEDADRSGLDDVFGWIVRRIEMRIETPPVLAEDLTISTFCGGLGSRWALRRTSITGSKGAAVEAAAIWVAIDKQGRPVRLSAQFHAIYGPAAAGRQVSARLSLPNPPTTGELRPWSLRQVDFDVLGHVNNAAHWRPVEELLSGRQPESATIEFGPPLVDDPMIRSMDSGDRLQAWIGESSTIDVRFRAGR